MFSMRYDLDHLPQKILLQPLAHASAALARLDERLAHSPVGTGLIERLHFADACASLWLDGELVEMEDLVLHEAARDIRSPSHQLTIAREVLQTRRRIAAQAPDWALSPNGFRSLRVGGQVWPAPSPGGGIVAESESAVVPDATVDGQRRNGEGENVVWMTGSTCPALISTPSTRCWHAPKRFWPGRRSQRGCRGGRRTR